MLNCDDLMLVEQSHKRGSVCARACVFYILK